MEIKRIHRASCHCKAIEFEVHLPNGLENPHRCDCSFCRMRGAIAASATLEGIKILKGADKLTLSQYPNQFGFNVACLEGVNPYELGEVPIMDGINHPADRKQ